MITVMNYLWRVQKNVSKCIIREYVSISNSHYKKPQDSKSTSRKFTKVLDAYLIAENSIESCYTSNGMRLVCEYRNSFTTTIGCFIPAGSMYEMPEERGSALFLEHLLFRRTTYRNQEQLERAVEEIGGRVASIAMRDMFLFYGTVPSCKINKLIELFADVILNGTICDIDVTTEKCIILHELSKMESNKEQVIMDYLPTIAYQNTPLGKSIYPETDVIKKFCTKSLIGFRNRLFKTCFMTMVCTGSICLQELEKVVCKYFHDVDNDETSVELSHKMQSSSEPLEYRFSGAELRLRDDDHELGYIAIGVEGPSYKKYEDHVALTVAKEIIGSWNRTSSGANHNAPYIAHSAFNTDLCETYKSFSHSWVQSTSIWGCYFVCDKLSLHDMLHVLQKEWMRLCTTITQREVSRAINQCKMKELMLLSDPVNHFFDIVKHLFRYEHYKPIQQRVTEYESITADKIREVSGRYIYDQDPAVVALGRIENFPEYCFLRTGMYLLRY